MVRFIKLILSLILFFFLVIQPVRSSVISSMAYHYQLPVEAQIILVSRAVDLDKCEVESLDYLGDLYMRINNQTMAAFEYGRAIVCSPGNALMRIKFGECLLALNFIDGLPHVEGALALEPNNPIFQNEYARISKALQSQSQSQ